MTSGARVGSPPPRLSPLSGSCWQPTTERVNTVAEVARLRTGPCPKSGDFGYRKMGVLMAPAHDASWDPWSPIPQHYNLGVALTRTQVRQDRGDKPALLWENAAGQSRAYTYAQLDALSNRLASALARLGV